MEKEFDDIFSSISEEDEFIFENNEVIENYRNIDNYIEKLLILAPNYFKKIIRQFWKEFNFEKLEINIENKINDNFQNKIKFLKDILKKLNHDVFLENSKNEKSIYEKYKIDLEENKEQEVYKKFSKLKKSFRNDLSKEITKLKSQNKNKEFSKSDKTFEQIEKMNLEEFLELNEKLNKYNEEKEKSLIKKNKFIISKKSIIFLSVLISLFFIIGNVFIFIIAFLS